MFHNKEITQMCDRDRKIIPAANENRDTNDSVTEKRGGSAPIDTTNELPDPPTGGTGEKSED